MKRVIAFVISGALGVAICIGTALLSQALHLIPNIPAPGGEDDFAFRAGLFFFGLCPAFAILGIWISAISEYRITAAMRSWVGALGGSLLALISVRALKGLLEGLTADGEGNLAIALLFASWLMAAAVGAYLIRAR